MQETLIKIINEKLNTEEIENKITTIVEKGITDAIQELFSWKGPLREEILKKLSEKTNEIIDDKFAENTANKINFLITESLKNTQIENFNSALEKIKDILGVENLPKKRSEIDLDYLFNKYLDYARKVIKNIDIDYALDYEDPITYVEEGALNLDFIVSLTSELVYEKESPSYYNSNKKMYVLKFQTMCEKSDKIIENLNFEIFISNISSKYLFTSDNFYEFSLLDSFELFLMKLKNNGVWINEKSIDNYEKDEVVWETFEYEE